MRRRRPDTKSGLPGAENEEKFNRKMKKLLFTLIYILPMTLLACSAAGCNAVMPDRIIGGDPDRDYGDNDYMARARQTLAAIDRDLRIAGTDSYYENQERSQVSFIWGNIFLEYAYAEGAGLRADEWQGTLMQCYRNLEHHWSPDYKGIAGYATQPVGGGVPDRFYDENGWMAIGLARAYEQTGNRTFLDKAKAALAFTFSGEDDVLGGGIYFQETFSQYKPQKNTICSAVAIVASMKLYELTAEKSYLDDALRIEKWTADNLLDASDNLLWDAKIVEDGSVNTQKWTYNAGFMVRGWLKLYKATGEERFLAQARSTLAAADARWFNPINGALNDPGYFAFALVDAWFDLYDLEKDKAVLAKALRTIEFIHGSLRDANGRYPEYWNDPIREPVAEYDLRMQSCVAYLYMRAAGYIHK